ncbi:MAG: citrate synthase [Kiritimatiellae bacterium]|nr:citrate synthase [Kiritimatiellia bacterium]
MTTILDSKEELKRLSGIILKKSQFDPSLFAKYNVKRGLRDIDGKGVVAGLTQIGDVQASSRPVKQGGPPGPGRLLYRGYDIGDLANGFIREKRCGFEEIAYLILFGSLPSNNELRNFQHMLFEYRVLQDEFIHDSILKLTSRDIMNAMSQSVLALYVLDRHADDTSVRNVLRQCLRLIAVFPLLAAYCYRAYAYRYLDQSLVIHKPSDKLSTAANFLHVFREDCGYTELEERLLDLSLVLHAEHGGGNNSSFTTHVVTSTGTDTYSAITAALGSLKGPRHGGANKKVVQMFDDLKANVKNWDSERQIEDYLIGLVTKQGFDKSGLVYGIGHAVYSVSDPRSMILREQVELLAQEKGLCDEMRLYRKVEALAPEIIGRYRKIYKGISANVDFYSGFLLRLLNIPLELYTPIFAMARIVGWSAHRLEELACGGKIIRPAYQNVAAECRYIPIARRRSTL